MLLLRGLRRILSGLLIVLAVVLPGASHAFAIEAPAHPAAKHLPMTHALKVMPVESSGLHPSHSATGCNGDHRAPVSPCPCDTCRMPCCAPAIVDMAPPIVPAAVLFLIMRRTRPSPDRDYRNAPRFAQLRPPTRL